MKDWSDIGATQDDIDIIHDTRYDSSSPFEGRVINHEQKTTKGVVCQLRREQ